MRLLSIILFTLVSVLLYSQEKPSALLVGGDIFVSSIPADREFNATGVGFSISAAYQEYYNKKKTFAVEYGAKYEMRTHKGNVRVNPEYLGLFIAPKFHVADNSGVVGVFSGGISLNTRTTPKTAPNFKLIAPSFFGTFGVIQRGFEVYAKIETTFTHNALRRQFGAESGSLFNAGLSTRYIIPLKK